MLNENAKKSYEAFWAQEANGRACLHLSAQRAGTTLLPLPKDITARWEDLPTLRDIALHNFACTHYYADGFPSYFVNFGPGAFTAMIGGTYKLAPDTVWFENQPLITDFDKLPNFPIITSSPMYRLVDSFTKEFLRIGKNKLITSMTDIGGTFDILAALRGTQLLLTDLYDCPDKVKTAIAQMQPFWKSYFMHYADLLLKEQGAMSTWMPIYSKKAYYPLQCDFSAMLSPHMFAEFILPDLEHQTEYMARSVYHLDGPDELPHVDHLLSLPQLTAIQWTAGDGQPDLTDPCWFDLYARIQAAGKGLVLLGGNPNGYENLLNHISTKGLFIHCSAESESHAKEIEHLFTVVGVT